MGAIKGTDIIGEQTYVLADGSTSQSFTFTIKSLRVGDIVIENVTGGVAPRGVCFSGNHSLNASNPGLSTIQTMSSFSNLSERPLVAVVRPHR
jgi:hypothetical protein